MPKTSTRHATQQGTLSLDARLAAADATMTVRMETALLRLGVDSAHVEQPTRLVDVINTPDADTGEVAGVLQRAQQRVLRPDGWTRNAGTRGGPDCLETAIQNEARTATEERDARIYLRRASGSGDPLTHINRHLKNAGQAAQLLGAAAVLAKTAA